MDAAENETAEDVDRQEEREEAKELSAPSGKIVYAAILKEGEGELRRSSPALFWSGLAAGLSMGFSMITEGLLAERLPDAPWRPLVSKLGYSVGFLIVILGRQQLFTENTLTPILPLLQKKRSARLGNVARLWGIVLIANLAGALAIALTVAHTSAFDAEVLGAFRTMGEKAMEHGVGTIMVRGVFAGWLVALMVWLLPFAESSRVWVIVIMTYVIGIAELSHVIAGAVETFTLAALGGASWGSVLGGYLLPTLAANIVGGVILVAMLNHAQVTAGGGGPDV